MNEIFSFKSCNSYLIFLFVIICVTTSSNVEIVGAVNETNGSTVTADLAVVDFYWVPANPIVRQPVTYHWKIKNVGVYSAGESVTTFWSNNRPVDYYYDVPALAPGEFVLQSHTMTYDGPPKIYQVLVNANYDGRVMECPDNEHCYIANNVLMVNLYIDGPPATCVLIPNPNQGIGPFTSNLTANFSYNIPPTSQFLVKCRQDDPGFIIAAPYYYDSPYISWLCSYPTVASQTVYIPSIYSYALNASCITTITNNPPTPPSPPITCSMTALPNQGIGQFTSNITATFSQNLPVGSYVVLACGNSHVPLNISIVNNTRIVSRLCSYLSVANQTIYYPSASGSGGAYCNTTVTDNPTPPSTCFDTDNGRIYGTRGTAYTNQTNFTDSCVDSRKLREFYCSTPYSTFVSNAVINCKNYGFTGCANGACYVNQRSRFWLTKIIDREADEGSSKKIVVEYDSTTNFMGWLVLGVALFIGLVLVNKRNKEKLRKKRH